MRELTREALDKIKSWEGLSLKAYKDSVGVWTIGYGHANTSGQPPVVKAGMRITKKQAEALLLQDIKPYADAVESAVKVELTSNQYGALVSFCYNVGPHAFKTSSVVRELNTGNYNSVPRNLMKWVKGGGHTIPGLVNRRAAEIALWNKDVAIAPNTVEPEEQKTSIIAVLKKPEVLATGGTVGTALIGAASTSAVIAWAVAGIVLVLGGIVAYFVFKSMRNNDT